MNKGLRGVMRPLRYLSTALLALASSSAMALGLGDIRVFSKPGQPLLAEIPVISADPSELQNLRVGLASPVTFERVGLQRPVGLVSELQFELTRNAQGRAVVRVTSQTPVDTPSLAFLIEADWGKGRLVREYSALVDAPNRALAVNEPEIVAPAGAMSNAIVREAQATDAAPVQDTATAPPAGRTDAAAAQPAAAASPVVPAGDGAAVVRRGQTLSEIAQTLARSQQVGRDRAMIALLRANPEAFIRGNINLLKEGAVLRMPDASELAAVEASEAAAMVREHTAQWRQSRTIPQPANAQAPAAPMAATATAKAQAADGARLEIAPAVAAMATTAGTTTGTGEGSEGDMLGNEQLRQAREDVATRDAEIDELKQRVAELETLQTRQQALVELKDTELAAVQSRLGQVPAERDASGPWYWLGLPLILLAALGWWLSRRRRPSPLPPLRRDDHDDSALSTSLPAGAGLDVLAERAPWNDDVVPDALPEEAPQEIGSPGTGADVSSPQALPPTSRAGESMQASAPAEPVIETPWVAADEGLHGLDPVPSYAREAEQQDAYRGVFELPAEEDGGIPDRATSTSADDVSERTSNPAGHDRLELAIAYLDLGDAQTARALLQEVVSADDPHLQAQARELLARLG
ncbi:FimV/HubP family polar landmark protein [Stenotrophomonas tumulicola]|uniref:Fimbrial protein FimV n=1 Tax=Stenotrophomonas tumulicola TaxID=1685415 RepID=A0A7W3FMY4_9GAMM|nr:FimV/HubP family polar landmark protein [Stenotrophomonas tumulicola]MBA8682465.1 fimbrial protein FimV [Stenotrophomonas tumulicola]